MPPGYALGWSGQFKYLERAKERLKAIIPITLGLILVILYLAFRTAAEVAIVLLTLPLALAGGLWLLFLLDFNMSIAVGVGFIALSGVAVEISVVMLIFLNQALENRQKLAADHGRALNDDDIMDAVRDGALLRVRPIIMTVAAITPVSATSDPTDRSIPPVMMIKVIPKAISASKEICLATRMKLAGVRNVSVSNEAVINSKTSTTGMRRRTSQWSQVDPCDVCVVAVTVFALLRLRVA